MSLNLSVKDWNSPPAARLSSPKSCWGDSNRVELNSFIFVRLDSPALDGLRVKGWGDCGGLCGFNQLGKTILEGMEVLIG